jgi:hypothetical protein
VLQYLALPIANKTAQNANDAINKRLTPLKHWVKTLTFDNGREFSWHEKLKSLKSTKDFLKPSLSFEQLDKVAYRGSDNKSADQLNLAKKRLFKPINEQKKG